MAKMTEKEMAKAEADLLAQEQKIKEQWCALKGHKWDLPQPNPLNSDSLECQLRCNRCNETATLTIAVNTVRA
jgi:hypothetical protein